MCGEEREEETLQRLLTDRREGVSMAGHRGCVATERNIFAGFTRQVEGLKIRLLCDQETSDLGKCFDIV